MRLRLRRRLLEVGEEPLLMGVVNASPESFSDGALASAGLEAQVERAHALVAAGAAIVDVGGESGVSHRPPVPQREEATRVVPLVERLAAAGITVSVDTWKPSVARAALAAGAVMVNDVSGLRDPAIADACAGSGAALVIAHTRVAPKEKAFPAYDDDVVAEVIRFLRERTTAALRRGVDPEQVLVDPGPDLGKTPAETIAVLRRLGEIAAALGRPVVLAASRKDFLGALTGRRPAARLGGTLAALAEGVDAGARVLRVHDVAQAADFLAVRAALRGVAEVPADLFLEERLRREPVTS